MAVRVATLVRAAFLGGAVIVALAAFVRPFEKTPPRRVPAPQPPTTERVTSSGLVAVDSRALLARIRRSPGRAVLVNMWASWCGSCKADVPMLLSVPKNFGKDVETLLVSVDEPSAYAAAVAKLQEFGASLPSYVVDEDLGAFKLAIDPRWPGMLPATFLFDTSGKVHYFWGGAASEKEVVPLVRRFLAGEIVDGQSDFALAPGKTQ